MPRASVVLVLILSAWCPLHAQNAPCTEAQGGRAEAEADGLRTWDALYKSYELYRSCDDGAIAEGYSESVARILVDHWNTLPRLADLGKKSSEFRQFVLKHIDATDDPSDLQRISQNAAKQCPTQLRTLCADLKTTASAALKSDVSIEGSARPAPPNSSH